MASKNDGFTSRDLSVNCKLTNRDSKWMANYEVQKAYIEEHIKYRHDTKLLVPFSEAFSLRAL